MCFFLYAPDASLRLEYVSETVTLDGVSATIMVDALIKNDGRTPLQSLRLLYPHSFVAKPGSTETRFDDLTTNLYDLDSPHNLLYRTMQIHPDWHPETTEFQLTVRNPLSDENKLYRGKVGGKVKIELLPGLTAAHWQVLFRCRTTPFSVELGTALQPGESSWVRWQIRPTQYTTNRASNLRKFANWMQNKTEYRYRIVGPFNVRANFVQTIQAFVQACHDRTDGVDPTQVDPAIQLRGKLLAGLSSATVTVDDWRLIVLPGQLGNLEGINKDGDVATYGEVPVILRPPPPNSNRAEEVDPITAYMWRAGEANVPSPTQGGMFSVNFVALPPNPVVRFLPWIALAIGLEGLWERLFVGP